LEAGRVAAQPPGAGIAGEHRARSRQQCPTEVVEVVTVVVVGEQDRVDAAELRRGHRRAGQLFDEVPQPKL
jgi:hypothetical protein